MPADKPFVSRFLDDAQQILEAAEQAAEPDVAILFDARRRMRVVAGKGDWPLDSLMAEAGASTGYRVLRKQSRVIVEGRSGSESCILERQNLKRSAGRLPPEHRTYLVIADQCGSVARMLPT
jgi:hypothetical protein